MWIMSRKWKVVVVVLVVLVVSVVSIMYCVLGRVGVRHERWRVDYLSEYRTLLKVVAKDDA